MFYLGPGLTSKPANYHGMFSFADMQLPILFWQKVSEDKQPSLKRCLYNASANDDGADAGARVETREIIKRSSSYRHPTDKEVILTKEQIIKGMIRYDDMM